MDPTQRFFGIEREGDLPIRNSSCLLSYCLANFQDEFVFLFSTEGFHRYSLAEDKWEELPRILNIFNPRACSLGDKVYVLTPKTRGCAINVLHNAGAPVSSQEIRWQDIEVLGDVPIPDRSSVFAPLNSTEIVIAGGMNTKF